MNKYNAIKESFISDAVLNDLLSAHATPPADLSLIGGDFTVQTMYSQISAGGSGRHALFDPRDHPRILGVAMFCNIADGLVKNDAVDDDETGLVFQINLDAFDGAGVFQTNIDSFQIKVPELNQFFETDFLYDVSTAISATTASLRVRFNVSALTMDFATITVHPDFAAKRLIFTPEVIMEHTFPMLAGTI